MSQFQLPDGTRLWAEEYQNEKIAIHLRNEIELEQWGSTDVYGKTADIQLDKQGAVEIRLINRPSSNESRLSAGATASASSMNRRSNIGLTVYRRTAATLPCAEDQRCIRWYR